MACRVSFGLKPSLGLAVSAAALLAACSGSSGTTEGPKSRLNRPAFTEAEYGVSTSPRLTESRGSLRKGGGGFKLGSPYKVAGRWYVPREEPGYDRSGVGSWYGDDFHGRKTANGELFDMHALTAAHPTLPMPSYVYVTNLQNGRTILARVNDRGPYVSGRIIDLSHASARALGYDRQGHANVRVRYAGRAPLNGDDRRERQYLAQQPWYRGGMPAVASFAPPQAPVSMPEPFPANTAGRWSPAAYRAGLAGKPLPSGARPSAPRMAVTNADEGSPPPAPARRYAQNDEQGGGGEGGLVWQASPRGQARSYQDATGSTQRTDRGSAAYVQVGVYRQRSDAERLRRDLGELGPVEVATVGAGDETFYRVRIGPMGESAARAALADVSARGVAGSSVVIE